VSEELEELVELVLSTLTTVWLEWLDVGLVVSTTALPVPAARAATAIPAAARVETRLRSLLRSKG
jgi:hypothetical protein